MTQFWDEHCEYFEKINFQNAHYFSLNSNTHFFCKFDWDYAAALNFQEQAVELVRKDRNIKIFILCNHPHCFTLGRGLQKGKDAGLEKLVDFAKEDESKLSFPLFRIKRGGGLTFHYPGQWIIYPIVNLNNPDFSLKTLTYWLLASAKKILESKFHVEHLDYQRSFLGLWQHDHKIASVGIGVSHFVTHHGLALNLVKDEKVTVALKKINPCGLDARIYRSISEICPDLDTHNLIGLFNDAFISSIHNGSIRCSQ